MNTGSTLQTKSGSLFSSATLGGATLNATSSLCIAGDCKTAWGQVGGSNWSVSGSDIYFNLGNVAIGTSATSSRLHVLNSSGDDILKLSRGASTSSILRVGTDGALVIQNQSNDTLTLKDNQIIAGASQGTAPLVITSTTKVANLNADLLDGMDSSAFGDATAANQTTILNRIGTSGDGASLSSTLFAGQQYLWDNRGSFGVQSFTEHRPSNWSCTVRSAGGTSNVTVSCSGSEKVIAGGCDNPGFANQASRPSGQGWFCQTNGGASVTAYANCCQ